MNRCKTANPVLLGIFGLVLTAWLVTGCAGTKQVNAIEVKADQALEQSNQALEQARQANARSTDAEDAVRRAELAADRKAQVGSGDRSEKIRTYNYPQSRVTDHRVGFSSHNLPAVMDGDLDPFIDALIVADEAEKLAAAESV